MDMEFTTSRAFETDDSAPGLRPLGWSELCARLAAAQDLRRIGAPGWLIAGDVASHADGRWGSFHHPSARMLLDGSSGQPLPEWDGPQQAEGPVNPNCSMDGNDGGGTPWGIKTTSPNSSGAELIRRELP